MVYYIIRFLIVSILFAAIIFLGVISRTMKIPFLKPQMPIWKRIIYGVALLCIIYMIFQPVEDLFLRFDTVEDSYYYSQFKSDYLLITEDNDCAFVHNINLHSSSLLHTVTKHENGWGITDAHYKSEIYAKYILPDPNDYSSHYLPAGMAIKNTETGKTFIEIIGFFGDTSTTGVYDSARREYKPLYRPIENSTEQYCIGYYTIFEGDMPDSVTFYFENEEYTIYK